MAEKKDFGESVSAETIVADDILILLLLFFQR